VGVSQGDLCGCSGLVGISQGDLCGWSAEVQSVYCELCMNERHWMELMTCMHECHTCIDICRSYALITVCVDARTPRDGVTHIYRS